jgi:hypothetical protein
MLEEFENECDKRRNRRECCIDLIDLILFFLAVVIALIVGLILGAVFAAAILALIPTLATILGIAIILLFTRIFVLLCCRRN